MPLLALCCTCNCSCGVLCLSSGCFSCQLSLWQQPAFHNGPTSTTSLHHHHQPIIHGPRPRPQLHHLISRHEDIHFPATILQPAGCWLSVWRKAELSPSSFGRGAGWECPVATGSGEMERVGLCGLPSTYNVSCASQRNELKSINLSQQSQIYSTFRHIPRSESPSITTFLLRSWVWRETGQWVTH